MIEGIIVDAGHGGIDSGAVGNNLLEKDLNLQVSEYIYNRLKELGIPTKLVRDNDEYLPKEERVRRIKNLYNNSPNTILISNHMNAGNGEGAEVVYSLKNNSYLADLILSNIKNSGQKVRKTYQRRLPENPNLDYYYILRETGNTTPVLIEYGFIDNINDSNRLKNNLNDYGEAVVKAITEYINYPYTPKVLEYYTVQRGDTLYSLSRKFNIPIDKLIEINDLKTDILSIGQILYLQEKTIDNDYDTYEVVKGDSLWNISKRFNIKVNDLIELNKLRDNIITIGQTLLIPKQDNTYIVEKGDTLWSIAKKNNITVQELKELNNLTNNTISINQVLKTK
jgi:LysM repeat protein